VSYSREVHLINEQQILHALAAQGMASRWTG
jgi:hypothetical protein